MQPWFFTADLHLDHPWMTSWRGFNYVKEMDEHIIEQWNNTVSAGNNVCVLGDVYWSGCCDYILPILKRLNGNILFVKGNHDYWMKKCKIHFRRIWNRKIKISEKYQPYLVMCHYPMWTWNRKDYGAIHLHGHSHGKTLPRVNMLDVGIDSAKIILGEYRPFSLDEVLYLTTTTKPEERY